jgi:hypothetical protein
MSFLTIGALFLAIAYAAWRNGSHFAYMMAAFIGAGNLFYMIGNGLAQEVWYVWAMTAGLLLVGYLRDPKKQK